jgi:hypothetical protein
VVLSVNSVSYTCSDSELECGGAVVVFTPAELWNYGDTIYWSIRATDMNENQEGSATTGSFTTVAQPDLTGNLSFGLNSSDDVQTCLDTFINKDVPDDQYTDYNWMGLFVYPVDTVANKSLIKFDLSSYTGVITSAKLFVYATSGAQTISIGVHEVTGEDPDIPNATWNTFIGNQVDTAEIIVESTSTDAGWLEFNIPIMVQNWIDSPASNYGCVLVPVVPAVVNTHRYLASSEDPDGYRPRLVINGATIAEPSLSTPSGIHMLGILSE